MAKIEKLVEDSKKHLVNDEKIITYIYGTVLSKMATGVFLVTDKRIVFYAKKIFGFDLDVYTYSKISSVEVSNEMNVYYITLSGSGTDVKIKTVSDNAIEFVNEIREKLL